MNSRTRLILIVCVLFLAAAVAAGIYLFPREAPPTAVPAPETPIPGTPPIEKKIAAPTPPPSPAEPALAEKAGPGPRAEDLEDDSYVSYPDDLMGLLGINMNDLLAGRDAFQNTVIHVGWMDRINEVLKDLDPAKKAAIIKNHTTLLYIKDKLNTAYLTGKIDHETFKKAIADLMKWHQRTYAALLSQAEYESLFEISMEKVDETIDAIIDQTPEYSFILNPDISAEGVKEQVQGYKLEEVNAHFKKMILDRDAIGKQINAGTMTLDQAREALNQSQQAFINKCKEILTAEEIDTIFGSVRALETGSTQTEPPAVLGDSDEAALGFKIENPETTIDAVTEKIDPQKREDIRFFYQERAAEREKLIEKLDAGDITSEEVENISGQMDAAFLENCRSILTDAEYQLIFGNSVDPDAK